MYQADSACKAFGGGNTIIATSVVFTFFGIIFYIFTTALPVGFVFRRTFASARTVIDFIARTFASARAVRHFTVIGTAAVLAFGAIVATRSVTAFAFSARRGSTTATVSRFADRRTGRSRCGARIRVAGVLGSVTSAVSVRNLARRTIAFGAFGTVHALPADTGFPRAARIAGTQANAAVSVFRRLTQRVNRRSAGIGFADVVFDTFAGNLVKGKAFAAKLLDAFSRFYASGDVFFGLESQSVNGNAQFFDYGDLKRRSVVKGGEGKFCRRNRIRKE